MSQSESPIAIVVEPRDYERELTDFQSQMMAVWNRQTTPGAIARREFGDDERQRIINAILRHAEDNGGITATRLSQVIVPHLREPALLADMVHRGELMHIRRPTGKRTKNGHIRYAKWFYVPSRLTTEQSRQFLNDSLTDPK